jgi:hypothetical protein
VKPVPERVQPALAEDARTYTPWVPSSDRAAADTWAWVCAQAVLNAETAAAAAAAIAARHEGLVTEGSESIRRLHSMMAATHRRIENCHRTAASRSRAQADRMASSFAILAPDLLGTVARALGARSAALTLLGSARYEESAVASNSTAAAAQELEFTLGEGPVHDAAKSPGRPRIEADDRRVGHQANGMIAARLRCQISDALALLRARAFAENEAIGVLARRVGDREVQFK